MKWIKQHLIWLVFLITVLFSGGVSHAAVWDIGNYDGLTIDDAGVSATTGFPNGEYPWYIRYGSRVTNTYNPMWRQWLWYRIGTADKEASFSKLPATGVYNADQSGVALTFNDTQVPARFKATVTFAVTNKTTYSYNSTSKKTITIQNLTAQELDYHLFSYSDLDISVNGTLDNAAIVNGDRALQTGFDAAGTPVGYTLVQTSTIKPSAFGLDTLSGNPGSILDSLDKTGPTTLANDKGPNFENTDMQFAFQYDLNIPANGSVSFDITNDMVETKPLHITYSQAGAACADYAKNATFQACVDNTTNTIAVNNVVVTQNLTDPDTLEQKLAYLSSTDNGAFDPATNTITWKLPSLAAGASKCVQATLGINSTRTFSTSAMVYSDEAFPAQSSASTMLCNYPPYVTSLAPSSAKNNVLYSYQITAADAEIDPLTFTLVNFPSGMTMDAKGLVKWTPTYDQAFKSFQVGVDISDGHSTIRYTFNIYVDFQNSSPSAPVTQPVSAKANQPVTYQVLASDPDNQPLTYTTTDILPTGLALSSAGLLSGTPTISGQYTVNVKVTDTYNASVMTAVVINVTSLQIPTITWAAPAAITYPAALSNTQLNATASVPGSFVYTPAAGTVLNAGDYNLSVLFTPTDTANYTTNTANAPLKVNKANQAIGAITFNPATVNVGGTTTASATASSGLAVTFSSNTPTVCTVSGSTVTALTSGTCTIAANQAGDTNYNAAAPVTGSITIPIVKTNQTIGAISFNPATLTVGGTTTASATATSGLAVTFSSTTPTVCTVSGSTVTAIAAGTCTIAANQAGNANYNAAAQVVGNITVAKASATVTLAGLTATYDGTAKAVTATTNPAGLAVTITYGGSATAPTVAGTYAVVATINNANYTGSATGNLVIAKGTPTITWPTPAPVVIGTVLSATQLNATANVAGTFVYTPASGTAMNTAGSQTLSVSFTPSDTTNYNTATKSVTILVNNKIIPTITWATPAAITYGTALSATQLNATASVAGTFTYTPAAGTILSAGSQTLSVSFTPTDTATYNNATANVTLTVNKVAATVTLGGLSATYDGTTKSATTTTTPAGLSTSITYNGSATAPTTAGSYTVIATITSANYTGSTTGTLIIAKTSQTIGAISFTPTALNVGGITTSSAIASSGLTVSFSSMTPTVCTVSGGTVTGLSAGACTIAADQAGNTNFNPAGQVTQTITVTTQVDHTLTITSTPVTTAYREKLYTYAVKAVDTNGDPLVYKITAKPHGMKISSTGVITWRPSEDQNGTYKVTVLVSDGTLLARQTFAVTVRKYYYQGSSLSYETDKD